MRVLCIERTRRVDHKAQFMRPAEARSNWPPLQEITMRRKVFLCCGVLLKTCDETKCTVDMATIMRTLI